MEDQTIIRPTPGGRRPQRSTQSHHGHGEAPSQRFQEPSQSPYGQEYHQPSTPVRDDNPYPQSGRAHHDSYDKEPPYSNPDPRPQNSFQSSHYQSAVPQEHPGSVSYAHNDDNPLLTMVAPLLAFASKIQSASECPNLDEFHRYSLDQLNFYRNQAWGINADPNMSYQISYAICSLIDEIVLNTPWGSTSRWSGDSMLINFHQEAWGGENFFKYLQELMSRPATNLLVLEFYYCCLSLGFEGRYRRLPNGRRELDQLRSELYIMISRHRDREVVALSPNWIGLNVAHQGFVRHLPQWILWSVAGFLLAASFIGFNWYLNQKSDQVMNTLAVLGQSDPIQVTPGNIDKLNRFVPTEPPVLDFQRIDLVGILTPPLKNELDSGVIEIIDDATHTRVRIRHSKLFASGQSDVAARFVPLIERIGEIIPDLSAPIEVQGHSDNVPIFSARFPSNWVLSKARADAVGDLLRKTLPGKQIIRTEGMADSEPLVPNTSAQNRALNRRVEIVLRK